VVRHPHRDRLQPAREVVGRDERGEHEQALIRRPDDELGLAGEQQRPDVQGVPRRRRHPLVVVGDEQVDGVDEDVHGKLGQAEPARAVLEPSGVGLGPEGRDRPVGTAVDLEPLEHRLAVVQRRGRGVQDEWPVGRETSVLPAAVAGPADRQHVLGEDPPEPGLAHAFGPRGRCQGVLCVLDVDRQTADGGPLHC